MPNYSGIWSLSQQFQGRGQGLWPTAPGIPTIGTATLVTTTSATVAFTAPACAGVPATITAYEAISTPGCITATGASSPVTVTGLTAGTAYTFRVRAQNATNYGPYSGSSNSVQARVPNAPTIGTATAGICRCATVSFSAPACIGSPGGITSYTVTSTPGGLTVSGGSSPLTVSGLTGCTSYTFKAKATNVFGTGACSAASNSITAKIRTCAIYTTPGTYTWVAPAGVTSVAVLTVGGGGGGSGGRRFGNYAVAGGGGALAYRNAVAVTPGSSYTVVVGARGTAGAAGVGSGGAGGNGGTGGQSKFCVGGTAQAAANGGAGGAANNCTFAAGGTVSVGTGGAGGRNGSWTATGSTGAGGAGGYSGAGGAGGTGSTPAGAGAAGSGGGGGGSSGSGTRYWGCGTQESYWGTYCGGGVGLYGQGGNGTGGFVFGCGEYGYYGGAGSGGCGVSYGGGGGAGGGVYYICSGTSYGCAGQAGGVGAVRIVWAGGSRGTPSFPSTNVGA